MLAMTIALAATAVGGGITQEFVWDLSIQGNDIGERALSIEYVPTGYGMRRVIEGMTEIDASAAGVPFTYRQRITAHSEDLPASFHSTVEDNGEPREIQGRLTPVGWVVTVIDRGSAKSWDLKPAQIDLSTADFFDPQTRVALSKYDRVRVLSAETGDVWEATVTRLGPSEVAVGGVSVPVEGIALDPPQGKATFYYTTDNVLVRYEYHWLGRSVMAVLRSAPPTGVDDLPVIITVAIDEEDLP